MTGPTPIDPHREIQLFPEVPKHDPGPQGKCGSGLFLVGRRFRCAAGCKSHNGNSEVSLIFCIGISVFTGGNTLSGVAHRFVTCSARRLSDSYLFHFPHSRTFRRLAQCRALTRQITLPTSSATSNAPWRSSATPTGRPNALPSSLKKPVKTSIGKPAGLPALKGTKITL